MKLLKEPFLHFLVAGAVLFGGYAWWHRGTPTPQAEGSVRVGEGEVRWLRQTFASQWRREPTGTEMNELLATFLNEELLAREARALGLDQNDMIVRRRLAQKLTFLVEETSRIAEPSEDELRRFYATHADRYRTEPLVSFKHVFFSPERRPDAGADADAALTMVSAAGSQDAKPPAGDPLLLEDAFTDVNLQAVSSLFGPDFARAVFGLPSGSWSGPVRSAYGIHLVQVTQRIQAEPRRFEDVRETITLDWRRLKEAATKEAYLGKLKHKYGVVIDDSVRAILDRTPTGQAKP